MQRDDADEFDGVDPEGPDESDMDSTDEPDFIACPECGHSISEDAERCHHCGSFVIHPDRHSRKSTWIVVSAIAVAVVLILWSLCGGF